MANPIGEPARLLIVASMAALLGGAIDNQFIDEEGGVHPTESITAQPIAVAAHQEIVVNRDLETGDTLSVDTVDVPDKTTLVGLDLPRGGVIVFDSAQSARRGPIVVLVSYPTDTTNVVIRAELPYDSLATAMSGGIGTTVTIKQTALNGAETR